MIVGDVRSSWAGVMCDWSLTSLCFDYRDEYTGLRKGGLSNWNGSIFL